MSFKEEFQKEQQRIIIDDIIERLSNENLEKLVRLIESGKLKEMLKKGIRIKEVWVNPYSVETHLWIENKNQFLKKGGSETS